MHHRWRQALIAPTMAVALPLSVIVVPNAQASSDFPTLSQESNNEVTDPATCVDLPSDEPVAVPYTAVAAAEELIDSGVIDDEIVFALNETDPNVTVVGPQPRALPAVAALAVAGVAWCVKGALSGLTTSALQQIVHLVNSNVPPPDWVMSAIFDCAGGPVLGALTSQAMRVKFAGAVLATVIKLRNFG